MRWKSAPLEEGQIRRKKRFLFGPKTICGETRWLEVAGWGEECQKVVKSIGLVNYHALVWEPIHWDDNF